MSRDYSSAELWRRLAEDEDEEEEEEREKERERERRKRHVGVTDMRMR